MLLVVHGMGRVSGAAVREVMTRFGYILSYAPVAGNVFRAAPAAIQPGNAPVHVGRRGDSMTSARAPLELGGFSLNGERHICAFFHDKDEEYQILLPFIADGIRNGEKAIHLIDENYRAVHARRLKEGGIDVRSVEASGQLEIRGWGDAYLERGRFEIDAMLAMIAALLDGARAQGFPRTRLVADMAWALMNRPGVADLIAYEARLNALLEGRDDAVICVYDLSRFGGAVVMDVMKTHPLAVVSGVMQHNPFHIAPREMLLELDRRIE